MFPLSVQVEHGSHLAGHQATGVKVQEGVEITEMGAEALAVVTLMAGQIMVIGMAVAEGFQAAVVMVIREMIIWEPVVAA